MGELFGELIGYIFFNIIGYIFFTIGGVFLDAPLKLMGIKISWGFCAKKYQFPSFLNMILLILVPIHLYNWGLTNGLFVYLSIYVVIVAILYRRNINFTPVKESPDLLDDHLPR